MPLPYEDLLVEINQTPKEQGLYSEMTARFKTWINNQTRLNATNMNELVSFIRSYSEEVGNKIELSLSTTLSNFVELNAGWKVTPDELSFDAAGNVNGRTVKNGELFNDYANNTAEGLFSSAEGTHTAANGANSHAQNNSTTANGDNSTSIGSNTIADGENSLSGGLNSNAKGKNSIAFGSSVIVDVNAENGVALGSNTSVSGINGVAIGDNVNISGANSFGAGQGLILGYDGQIVFGKYNDNQSSSIVEVGGGTSDNAKKNVFVVRNDGYIFAGVDNIVDNSPDNTLVPKGYVDQEIERLDKNVWLGCIDVTTEQYHDEEQFVALLNSATKEFTKDTNPPDGRNPKNGDQLTVKITNPTVDDPEYPEIWMFRDPDPKPPEEDPNPDGKWLFFSSLQQLVDATKTVKGLVQIGDNINVSDGLISVPNATKELSGVVKLSDSIITDDNGALTLVWGTW